MSAASRPQLGAGENRAFALGRALLGIRGILALVSWYQVLIAVWVHSAAGLAVAAVALVLAVGTLPLGLLLRTRGGWAYGLGTSLLFLDACLQTGLLLAQFGGPLQAVVLGVDLLTAMIIAIRDVDRERGSGWLDCPHCTEHAQQDVIDRLRFVRLFGYRLGIIYRRRDLICRRCQFRRPAADEVKELNTAGARIRLAWLPPMGFLGLALSAAVVYYGFIAVPKAAEAAKVTYVGVTGTEISGPFSFDEPTAWNHQVKIDAKTGLRFFHVSQGTSAGQFDLYIKRAPASSTTTLSSLVAQHYRDDFSPNTEGYPESPPAAQCATVGGQKAAAFSITFTLRGDRATSRFHVFLHDGWAYTVEAAALQDEAIKDMAEIANHVVQSFNFTGTEPPAPSPSSTTIASPGSTTAAPSPTSLNGGGSSSSSSPGPSPSPLNC